MIRRDPQAGMAMVTALVALMLITVIGLALTSAGMMSVTVATNDRDNNEALTIADAGLTHAKALLLNQVWVTPPKTGYTPLLQRMDDGTNDHVACTGDEFATVPAFASSPYPPAGELIPAAGRVYPAGNGFGGMYQVRLCDDHSLEQPQAAVLGTCTTPPVSSAGNPCLLASEDGNRRILVRSRGLGRNGAEATLEGYFMDEPLPALLVDGDLHINGNVAVMGTTGAIHANGNLDIDGTTACAQLYYSAVGNIDGAADGGLACTSDDADARPGSNRLPVPKLDPNEAKYRMVADYVLDSANQRILCGPANNGSAAAGSCPLPYNAAAPHVLMTFNNPPDTWGHWKYSKYKWSFSKSGGSAVYQGTYWTDGNIEFGTTGGTEYAITLIALGWVDITGNAKVKPDAAPGEYVYAVVAGTDLRIAGDLATGDTYEGLYYARDQIDFVGTPDITGMVVARNLNDIPWPPPGTQTSVNLVPIDPTGYMDVSGNVNITYDGGAGWNYLRIASWRECRGTGVNASPANPCGDP